jgi:hypothetical protein
MGGRQMNPVYALAAQEFSPRRHRMWRILFSLTVGCACAELVGLVMVSQLHHWYLWYLWTFPPLLLVFGNAARMWQNIARRWYDTAEIHRKRADSADAARDHMMTTLRKITGQADYVASSGVRYSSEYVVALTSAALDPLVKQSVALLDEGSDRNEIVMSAGFALIDKVREGSGDAVAGMCAEAVVRCAETLRRERV